MSNQILAAARLDSVTSIIQSSSSPSTLRPENVLISGGRTSLFRALSSDPLFFNCQFDRPRLANFIAITGVAGVNGHRNLLQRTTDLENDHATIWDQVEVSVSESTAVFSPAGSYTDAFYIDTTANNDFHSIEQLDASNGVNAALFPQQLTLSCYVKPTDRDWIQFWMGEVGGPRANTFFNPSTGATNDATGGSNVTHDGSTIEDVGDGWYRCSFTATFSATFDPFSVRFYLANSGSITSFAGSPPNDGMYLYAPMLELGSTASLPAIITEVDDLGTWWKFTMASTEAKLTSAPDYDSGPIPLIMNTLDADFRGESRYHSHHVFSSAQQYEFYRVTIYNSAYTGENIDLTRVIIDDAWIAPLVPDSNTNVYGVTASDLIQQTDTGSVWAVSSPRYLSPSNKFIIKTKSDAYDRYHRLTREVGSSGEVYMALNDEGGVYDQDKSIVGYPVWDTLVSIDGAGLHSGGVTIVESE